MRLSRGDVVLRWGGFALVWDAPAKNRMRIFPITDACDGFEPHDVIVNGWQGMYRASAMPCVAIRLTQARFSDPIGWLKLPDLGLELADIQGVSMALDNFALERGAQQEWPYVGSDVEFKAPVFAS